MSQQHLTSRYLVAMILTVSAVVTGCSDQGPSSNVVDSGEAASIPVEGLRLQFEQIVESGYAGSGLPGLKAGIEELNKPAVTQEFSKLEAADAAGNADAVRASARRILGML